MNVESRIGDLEKRLQELSIREVRCETRPDADRKRVIGIVRYSNDPNVRYGMIVLFTDQLATSLKPYTSVYLAEYEVRQSRIPDRYYVKCFRVYTAEEWNDLMKKIQEEKTKIEEELKKLKELQQRKEQVYALAALLKVSAEEVERAMLLGKEALAGYLASCGHDVVYDLIWDQFIVLRDDDAILFYLTVLGHKVLKYPIRDRPDKFVSKKNGIIYIDDAKLEEFEAQEIAKALASRGFKVFWWGEGSGGSGSLAVIIPKDSELFRKLMAVKTTDIPAEIKKLIYCEVLGLNPKELPEVSKSAW
mgnify:CR=1 FL=1